MKSFPPVPILLASILAAPPVPLPGQEEPEAREAPVRLPEIVVTATREETETDRLPYASHALPEEAIRLRQTPRSLPDALDELPGVSVQKTGSGLESPFLRGFTGFRTLLLIDGIRLNNAVFRDGPNQYWGTVDPLAIHRLEAVLGPSSVLYGSDAIGGTVNAITLEDFPDGHHPGMWYRFASAEDSHTVRGDIRGRQGSLGYTGGVTWRDHGDINAGVHVGEQENTGYDALSGDAKVSWEVSPELRLTVAHQTFDQDATPRTHSTVDGISWRGTTVGSDRKRDFDQERFLSYVRAQWRPEARWLESTTLTLSHHLQREREERIRSNGRLTRQGFEDHTAGVIFSALTPTPVGRWTWGAEYYFDYVDSFRSDYNPDGSLIGRSPRGPVADEARYGILGIFIQDRYAPVDWMELTVGGRYNLIHVDADKDDIDPDPDDTLTFDDISDTFEALVGSARMIFHPIPWLSPYIGVSQGFRAPNLADLTRFDVARSGEVETPAPDLDPERFIGYEGGLHFRGAHWGATVAYYYTDVRDLIIRLPTGRTIDGLPEVTKDNVGDGYYHGVDVGARWEFLTSPRAGNFTVLGNFSWVEGRLDTIDDDGDRDLRPISKRPPTSFLFGLRWEPPSRKVWLEGTYRLVLEQDHLSPADRRDTQRIPPGGTPGYRSLTVRGGWNVLDSVRIFAAVENITGEDYRVHGSGVNGPGTNFVTGLEARW